MSKAENIKILFDGGYAEQAERMAQNECVAFVEEMDSSICAYEFEDGSIWEPKTNTVKEA